MTLGWKTGLAGELAEHGQPQPGEEPRPVCSTERQDRVARAPHLGGVGVHPAELQGVVALDADRQIAGAREPHPPQSVLALGREDLVGHAAHVVGALKAEGRHEEDMLGCHRRVGLELSPPEAAGVLDPLEAVRRSPKGVACRVVQSGIGRRGGRQLAGPPARCAVSSGEILSGAAIPSKYQSTAAAIAGAAGPGA